MKRLVLIDGNAILHRAYHALPPLTTPQGAPVGAVYGFVSMLIKIVHDYTPSHLAVAFDRPGLNFRQELFKDYQAQRPVLDDTFISQIGLIHDVLDAFGIPVFEMDGFEADDVIGTIIHEIRNPKSEIQNKSKIQHSKQFIDEAIVVTGDRDLLQLVDDARQVRVFLPTKGLSEGKVFGEADVTEKMGVPPRQIPDLKALMGDASDNYPGVPGIGPKTAAELLKQFGSVEHLYAAVRDPRLSETVRKKLVDGHDSATLGKTLATIRRDVPIRAQAEALQFTSLDSPSARTMLTKLNVPSLLKRITGDTGIVEKPVKPKKKEEKKGTDDTGQLSLV